MDPEKKEISNLDNDTEQDPKDFGKIIDTLHSKQKLPSLRTYQGDMAEFIKEKNESVISIAVKEKEKKEEKAEEEEKFNPKPKSTNQTFKIKFTMAFLSLLLVAAGTISLFYVFTAVKSRIPKEVILKEDIIPYNNLVTLANVTNENLETELTKLSASDGVNIIKLSDSSGLLLLKAKDFFNFLKISLPGTLERTLKDDYVVGAISGDEGNSSFMIITVNDFGAAFSAMLDWEKNMPDDLSFLDTGTNTAIVSSSVASTTVSAIVASISRPINQETFSWRDIIVKNKDTRGLVNGKDQSKIAYTFLDKNTILITNNLSAIAEISSIYATRSVAR
jgi:hypothetical protein